VAGVERVRLGAHGIAPSDVLQLGALEGQLGTRREGEDPEPLEQVTGVATDPEKPAAPGLGGPDADAELEGAAVAGDPPTTDDQGEPVEQDKKQHDTGCVEQPLPQRHLSPLF
jgi:hypothetical protein